MNDDEALRLIRDLGALTQALAAKVYKYADMTCEDEIRDVEASLSEFKRTTGISRSDSKET